MEPIKCHRKYPITTNFLDTMLEHYVVIEEGESKLDAYRRGLKELDQIAAQLRKEAESMRGEIIQEVMDGVHHHDIRNQPLPIISKDKERIEIEIDNAETVEALQIIKKAYPLMPASCRTQYNKRLAELSSGRPHNFTEGLT